LDPGFDQEQLVVAVVDDLDRLARRHGQKATHLLEAVPLEEDEDAPPLVALEPRLRVEVLRLDPGPLLVDRRLRVDLVARIEVLAAPIEVVDDERLLGPAAMR